MVVIGAHLGESGRKFAARIVNRHKFFAVHKTLAGPMSITFSLIAKLTLVYAISLMIFEHYRFWYQKAAVAATHAQINYQIINNQTILRQNFFVVSTPQFRMFWSLGQLQLLSNLVLPPKVLMNNQESQICKESVGLTLPFFNLRFTQLVNPCSTKTLFESGRSPQKETLGGNVNYNLWKNAPQIFSTTNFSSFINEFFNPTQLQTETERINFRLCSRKLIELNEAEKPLQMNRLGMQLESSGHEDQTQFFPRRHQIRMHRQVSQNVQAPSRETNEDSIKIYTATLSKLSQQVQVMSQPTNLQSIQMALPSAANESSKQIFHAEQVQSSQPLTTELLTPAIQSVQPRTSYKTSGDLSQMHQTATVHLLLQRRNDPQNRAMIPKNNRISILYAAGNVLSQKRLMIHHQRLKIVTTLLSHKQEERTTSEDFVFSKSVSSELAFVPLIQRENRSTISTESNNKEHFLKAKKQIDKSPSEPNLTMNKTNIPKNISKTPLDFNVDDLAEKVYSLIERKTRIEKERRGM
jgi:hypothetical protein